MIERIVDAARVNQIVNDPSIYPWICGEAAGPLDLTEMLRDPGNHALFGEHGGVIFVRHQGGLYEAHTQVLPEGRGEWALAMVEAALHRMFCATDALEIVTRVPRGNIAARVLAQRIGGRFEFRRRAAWKLRTKLVDVDYFGLRIQDWLGNSPVLTGRSEWLTERLRQEAPHIALEEGDARYLAATFDMFFAAQPVKAVIFYNRWAAMCGKPPLSVITENPLVVELFGAPVLVRANDFWVMQCQSQPLPS